jgi:hypothetical protein
MARDNASTSSVSPVIGLVIAIAVLYFARDLLIPIAFALLLAFLLTPIVKRLEAWKIPRAPASVLVLIFRRDAVDFHRRKSAAIQRKTERQDPGSGG